MTKLYGFFSIANPPIYPDHRIITIDKSCDTLKAIANKIGYALYHDIPEKNPIYYGTYFGGNPDSFEDCFWSYFSRVKNTSVQLNFIEKGENVSGTELLTYFEIFAHSIADEEHFKDRLTVYASKNIIRVLEEECGRLRFIEIHGDEDWDDDPNFPR